MHRPRTKTCTNCPASAAIAIISGRWKVPIIHHLMGGTKRFSELKVLCTPVASKCLTDALRELEAEGIIVRTHYPEIPPRVEYELSRSGRTLLPVIESMAAWGAKRR